MSAGPQDQCRSTDSRPTEDRPAELRGRGYSSPEFLPAMPATIGIRSHALRVDRPGHLLNLLSGALWLLILLATPAFSKPPLPTADTQPGQTGQPSLSSPEREFLLTHPIIRLGVNQDWSPYVQRTPSGSLEGFEVDLINEINASTGAHIELVAGRWKETVEQAQNRQLDGLAMTAVDPERAAHFDFSNSYLSVYPALVVAADNQRSIDSLSDLHGETIVLLAGHVFYRTMLAAHPEITLLEKPTEAEVIRCVVEGKAAAAVIATTSFDTHLKNFARSIRLAHVVTDRPMNLHYSIRKDWPELVGIINKGLAAIPVERFNKLYYHWFSITAPVARVKSPRMPDFSPAEQAWLEQRHLVRTHIGNYMPYYSVTANQGAQGMAVDYLELIAERAGLRIEYVTGHSWSKALQSLREQSNLVDLLPTAYITDERKTFLNFSAEYLKSPSVIFARQDSPFIGSMLDLTGKTVVVERDYATIEWLAETYSEVNQLIRDSTDDALLTLAAGEADAYIGNLTVATYIARSKGLTNLMVAAPSPFGSDNQAMAVRKDWPELAGVIDKTLATLTAEEHEAIRARWLPPVRYEYGISRRDVLQLLAVSSGILLVIITAILIWNKKLSREVAARAAAEKALLESEASLKQAQQIARLGSWTADLSGRFCWSDEMYRIFAVARERFTPTLDSFALLVHPDDRPALQAWFSACGSGDHQGELLLRSTAADGIERTTSIHGTTRPPLDGRPLQLSGTAQDITEQLRLENERLQDREELYHIQKLDSLGRLAGGVAHDLNNLLVPIITCTELARLKLGSAEHPIVPLLQQVQKAGDRAAALVSQILSFGRRQKLDQQPLDLNRMISELQPILSPMLSSHIELTLELEPDLPQIVADRGKLEQVLVNLVINARDAMPLGGKLTIRTDRGDAADRDGCTSTMAATNNRDLLVEIRDTGQGIPPDIKDKIFEPYFSTKGPGKGSGLGLSMALGIVAQHHGSIAVESRPGAGTTFTIRLPASGTTSVQMPVREPPKILNRQVSETVLVVDDEDLVRENVSENLRQAGYRVIEANGGPQALEIFSNPPCPIDLLLTDLTMPQLDGRELAREISRRAPELPILFMSGYSQALFHVQRSDAPHAFIQKPFTAQELLTSLRRLLD